MFSNDEVIFSYTRAQGIADGVLIDVTAHAKELGFRLSTVVTAGVWSECIAVPEPDAKGARDCRVTTYGGQDESGRLHDVLFLAKLAMRASARGDHAFFEVKVLGADGSLELKRLWIHIGPGDSGEAVLTIMMQGED